MEEGRRRVILLVGLGNPGAAYVHTRHNLGQFVLDKFARVHNLKWVNNKRLNADLARGRFAMADCVLVRPLTYMNESGYPVVRAADYFKVKRTNVVVIYDDINLPLGAYKITTRSGDGGHNGMADVNSWISDCVRFRVGIGHKPNAEVTLKDYVLGNFTDEEQAALFYAMDDILDGLKTFLNNSQRPLDRGNPRPIESGGE